MTKDELKQAAEILLAAADGKFIQARTKAGRRGAWMEAFINTLQDWPDFNGFEYRIKPDKPIVGNMYNHKLLGRDVKSIELTPEVRQACIDAGIEIDE